MKLLNSNVSPFAARVRLAIHAYDLPVDIVPSGQWLANFQKSPDYMAINPIGLVPTLILDDGTALPESSVIVEYLADAWPGTGLRPSDAASLAKARLQAHLAELYVQMRGASLISQVFSGQPDPALSKSCVAAMDEGLSFLDHFMQDGDVRHDHAITIADCALVPFLFFFADLLVRACDQPGIISKHPRVAAYWHGIQEIPACKKLIAEMRSAIANSPLKALVVDAKD